MNNTPLTDSETFSTQDNERVVDAAFARSLEKELAATKLELCSVKFHLGKSIAREEQIEKELKAAREDLMTERRAREIFGEWITQDGKISVDDRLKMSWPTTVYGIEITSALFVEGALTSDQLTALGWWIKNMGGSRE